MDEWEIHVPPHHVMGWFGLGIMTWTAIIIAVDWLFKIF